MKHSALLVALLFCSGCSALKAKTGEFVTEAVIENIVSRVDKKLEERGLSRAEIKKVVDTNKDGKIDKSEVIASAKGAAKDLIALKIEQAHARQKERLKEHAKTFVTRGENQSVWDWIKGTIGGTLGLFALSILSYLARHWNHGKDNARLAVLEKLLQKDLDGDGAIGGAAGEVDWTAPRISPDATEETT